MHEYSVVASLLELCEGHVQKNGGGKVLKVVVALGERSGVEPQLFRSAFEVFKLDSVCLESELVLEQKRVRLRCRVCGAEKLPEGLDFGLCDFCDTGEMEMIEGGELHLMSLEMEVESHEG